VYSYYQPYEPCQELLSKELYSSDVHFVMELVQNAEDNEYPPSMLGDEALGEVSDRVPWPSFPCIEFEVRCDAITSTPRCVSHLGALF
jgi:hypothetical protein